VRSVEIVRSLDPDAPVVISLDQPWAEYTSRRDLDFPPLHFADALVRAGADLFGLMLEINLGYDPGGTLPRTPLEFSRQLDYWSILGLPLFVSITVPGGAGDDPAAGRRVQLPPGQWTAGRQQAWAGQYVPLLFSKPYIAGVFWNQLRDGEPHEFPHGGLIDAEDQPKPALQTLATIRRTHLE
jgi:hypothetical protein